MIFLNLTKVNELKKLSKSFVNLLKISTSSVCPTLWVAYGIYDGIKMAKALNRWSDEWMDNMGESVAEECEKEFNEQFEKLLEEFRKQCESIKFDA